MKTSLLFLGLLALALAKDFYFNSNTGTANSDCSAATPCKTIPNAFIMNEQQNNIYLTGSFNLTETISFTHAPGGPDVKNLAILPATTGVSVQISSSAADVHWDFNDLKSAEIIIEYAEFDNVALRASDPGGGLHLRNTKHENVASTTTPAVMASHMRSNGSTYHNNAGGAINTEILYAQSNTFSKNSATTGGAVYISGEGPLRIYDSVFEGNKANDGAAIHTTVSDVIITNTVFRNNSATDDGGALYALPDQSFVIDHCNFTGNTVSRVVNSIIVPSGRGGALFIELRDKNPKTFNVTQVHATGNSAQEAGVLYIDKFEGTWTGTVFVNNRENEGLDVFYNNGSYCLTSSCSLCQDGICMEQAGKYFCVQKTGMYQSCLAPKTCNVITLTESRCVCDNGATNDDCDETPTGTRTPYTYSHIVPSHHNPHSNIPTPVVVLICLLFVGVIGAAVYFFAKKFRQQKEYVAL